MKIIQFRENTEIEIYEDLKQIAFREDINWDDSSFIMFDKEEIKKLIKILSEIEKQL